MNKRVETVSYIKGICRKLKAKRKFLKYSIDDVKLLSGLSEYAVREVESTDTTNLYFILEYARALEYNIFTDSIDEISFEPRNRKEFENKNMTFKVGTYLQKAKFLNNGKVVSEIKEELILNKIIPETADSTYVAGIMRVLLKSNTVKNISESSAKHIYVLFDWENDSMIELINKNT